MHALRCDVIVCGQALQRCKCDIRRMHIFNNKKNQLPACRGGGKRQFLHFTSFQARSRPAPMTRHHAHVAETFRHSGSGRTLRLRRCVVFDTLDEAHAVTGRWGSSHSLALSTGMRCHATHAPSSTTKSRATCPPKTSMHSFSRHSQRHVVAG
jgi:hypothetical protein